MINVLYIAVSLLVFSYFATFFFRKVALRNKLLDIPNDRSSHSIPTPKGGGIAIVISWYAGITVLFAFDLLPSMLFFAFLSGIVLAIFSFIDDIISLSPGVRLVVQATASLTALIFLGGVDSVAVNDLVFQNQFVLYALALIGMIWFINLFNFLDGIDGYASLEAITVSAALFILTGNVVCIILIGCISGFIIWNWPKAKIFMGDTGSTQLGFILAVLAIYCHNTNELSLIQWLILTSLFWFDASLTLIRRIRNREKLSIAHRKHGYQRIVIAGFSHQKTILLSLMINIVLFILATLINPYPHLVLPFFMADILFLYVIMKIIDRKVPFA